MYTSIASGGPLGGVRVSSPLSWEGTVRHHVKGARERDSMVLRWHPGHYTWITEVGWIWIADTTNQTDQYVRRNARL
jgi:hypothetical protein